MGLFSSMELNSMEDLYVEQLGDLYDAEQRICKALPKMAAAAHAPELKRAFETHLRETENQVKRLEQCFKLLGKPAKAKTCEATKGLLAEGEEVVNAKGNPDVKDAALIASAQRVEHYEIAAYGCTRNFAMRCGQHEAASILQETLDEEGATDKKLTSIAEASVNVRAAT